MVRPQRTIQIITKQEAQQLILLVSAMKAGIPYEQVFPDCKSTVDRLLYRLEEAYSCWSEE